MSKNVNSILNHIPHAIFLLDREGYIEHCNEAATALTGYRNDEIKGHSLIKPDSFIQYKPFIKNLHKLIEEKGLV